MTATMTATHGEQPWTMTNNHELSIIMNSASMDAGGHWWTLVDMSAAIS
jgi:hypothetical protein